MTQRQPSQVKVVQGCSQGPVKSSTIAGVEIVSEPSEVVVGLLVQWKSHATTGSEGKKKTVEQTRNEQTALISMSQSTLSLIILERSPKCDTILMDLVE